jgi:hypothetical protein
MTLSPFPTPAVATLSLIALEKMRIPRFCGFHTGRANFLGLMTIRICSCAKPGETQLQSAAIPFPYGERVETHCAPRKEVTIENPDAVDAARLAAELMSKYPRGECRLSH